MAKQPLFDVLEDFLEMDSRPWKVKKNPIFSMPEASGKTSFLNKSDRTKNSAPHYDESLMGTSRKKMVRKDAKAEKKKPETRKLDIRKISLVRPDIPSLTPPPVPVSAEPDEETNLSSLSLPSDDLQNSSLTEQTPYSADNAPSAKAGSETPAEPAQTEAEVNAQAADSLTDQLWPEKPEPQDSEPENRTEEAGAETEPDMIQEEQQEDIPEDARTALMVPAETEENKPAQSEEDPFRLHEEERSENQPKQGEQAENSETETEAVLSEEKTAGQQPQPSASFLESEEKSPVFSSLQDILSSSQQTELFGEEEPAAKETPADPVYTGYAGTSLQPVINEKDLPGWAREVLSQNGLSDSVSLTSDGHRVWTFTSGEKEEAVSDSPFASLTTAYAFEEDENHQAEEEEDGLDEWKDDYIEESAPDEEPQSETEETEDDEVAVGDQDLQAISYPEVPGEEEAAQQLREDENRSEDEARPEYQCSTYEIVSLIAYLIGVPQRIFENEYEPPKLEVFERLDSNKHARIIRHLCICRTAIIRNYRQINDNMRLYHMSLNNMPDLVPIESLRQLSEDGVSFIRKTSTWPSHHIVEINKLINDRINNVKDIFPLWLNWKYAKNILLMPNGSKDKGTKVASDLYYANKFSYPYQIYINWLPGEEGNILFNDKKFVSLLYQQNHDSFLQMNKVSDAGSFVKDSIYNYIEESDKLTVMVDCENSDPYRLCATFVNLDQEYLDKISRIILFDDLHASSAWKILEQYTSIPVEYILTKRVKEDKSLVDMKLATRACKEHYQNDVDSFIIVSSDSDYWGLIETLNDARFLVMVEREKCGADIKRALDENGIFYCYIDSFYSGNAAEIQNAALNMELNRMLHEQVNFNAKNLFKQALHNARLNLSPAEKQQFYNRHIRQMTLKIEDDGSVSVELKR